MTIMLLLASFNTVMIIIIIIYVEVIEQFQIANNLWSHCALHIVLLQV